VLVGFVFLALVGAAVTFAAMLVTNAIGV